MPSGVSTAWPNDPSDILETIIADTQPPPPSPTHVLTLVPPDRFESSDAAWRALVSEVLPGYLASRRWFARDGAPESARAAYRASLAPSRDVRAEDEYLLTEFEVDTEHGPTRYFVPLAAVWSDATPLAHQYGMARLVAGPRQGLLTDAYTMAPFAHRMIEALRAQRVIDIDDGTEPAQLYFLPEDGLHAVDLPENAPVRWFLGEQSNSSLGLGGQVMLKLVRRVADAVNPEAEMTRRLTRVGFTHGAALLGEVVRRRPDGTQATLAIAHRSIANEGDAWGWTEAYLKRCVAATPGEPAHDVESYASLARAMGLRLAQMHAALAQTTDDPAFSPEPTTAADAQAWADDIVAMLARARKALSDLPLEGAAALARTTLNTHGDTLDAAVRRHARTLVGSLRTRIHGDFHLGQILVANDDAYLIDFEGEPARSPAERRAKKTPLRDVAGLLRSFAYARAAFLPVPANPAASNTDDSNAPDALLASRCEAVRAAFVRHADDAFLAQYRETLETSRQPWLSPDTLDAALPLAVMEKAAYEVVYEAGHRPTWLHIPLTGLIDMADRILAADTYSPR